MVLEFGYICENKLKVKALLLCILIVEVFMIRLCWVLFLFPFTAHAFDMTTLQEMAGDPEKMQQEAERLMREMSKAAECIDSEAMQKMKQEGEALRDQINALCSRGDRDGAQKAALDFSRKMMSSGEYKQLQECGKQLLSFLPPGYAGQTIPQAGQSSAARHICDN